MIENITAIEGMPISAHTLTYIDDCIKKIEQECFAKQRISKEDVLSLCLLHSYKEQFAKTKIETHTKTINKWDERCAAFRKRMKEKECFK